MCNPGRTGPPQGNPRTLNRALLWGSSVHHTYKGRNTNLCQMMVKCMYIPHTWNNVLKLPVTSTHHSIKDTAIDRDVLYTFKLFHSKLCNVPIQPVHDKLESLKALPLPLHIHQDSLHPQKNSIRMAFHTK